MGIGSFSNKKLDLSYHMRTIFDTNLVRKAKLMEGMVWVDTYREMFSCTMGSYGKESWGIVM